VVLPHDLYIIKIIFLLIWIWKIIKNSGIALLCEWRDEF
jgi:hypothetical protein